MLSLSCSLCHGYTVFGHSEEEVAELREIHGLLRHRAMFVGDILAAPCVVPEEDAL